MPVTTRDGVILRAMKAVQPRSKGTVVVLGGRGDFIERYFETARDLMVRGYSVAMLDVRGQGGSQRLLGNPMRCYIRTFADFDEDLRAFMTQIVLPDCPPPYFVLAHSTGGNILLHSLRTRAWFSKAVVVSPLIGIVYGSWPLPFVRPLVFLATNLGLGWMFLPGQQRKPLGRKDFSQNLLTSDQQRWNRDSGVLEAAPQLGLGGPTFSWLKAAMKSTAALKALGPKDNLCCPVLIVAAGLDRVVDNEAIRRFAKTVSGVSLVFVKESQHEILSEADAIRAQFFAAFDAFVGGRQPG